MSCIATSDRLFIMAIWFLFHIASSVAYYGSAVPFKTIYVFYCALCSICLSVLLANDILGDVEYFVGLFLNPMQTVTTKTCTAYLVSKEVFKTL